MKAIYEQLTYPNTSRSAPPDAAAHAARAISNVPPFPFQYRSRLTAAPKVALNQFEGDRATEYMKIRYFYLWGAVAVMLNYTETDWMELDFYGFRNFIGNNILMKECERYNFMKNTTLMDGDGVTFKELLHLTKREGMMQCGVYLEMLRYLFATFIEQYELYHLVNRIELKMEDFVHDFDVNLDKILDGLNVVDSSENHRKLRELRYGDINISAERERLSGMIKRADPHYMMANNGKERQHIHNYHHVLMHLRPKRAYCTYDTYVL